MKYQHELKIDVGFMDDNGLLAKINLKPDTKYYIFITSPSKPFVYGGLRPITEDKEFHYFTKDGESSKEIWIDAMGAFITHDVQMIHEEGWFYIFFKFKDTLPMLLGRLEDKHPYGKYCLKALKKFDINSYLNEM